MSVVPKITLYVDLVSPFGYIAYYLFRHDPVFKKCDVTYIPIFLGGLMKACGNQAPIQIKNKDIWIDKERRLWAQKFNVPMKTEIPPNFPILTLNIMRHLAALHQADGNQSRVVQALDQLSAKFWTNHDEIHKPEVFLPVLESILGSEDVQRLAEAAPNKGKEILTQNTEQAFQSQAFGLPWMICTNAKGETESFWGVDHLGLVVSFLGLDKPSSAGWRAVL